MPVRMHAHWPSDVSMTAHTISKSTVDYPTYLFLGRTKMKRIIFY